MKKIFLLMGLLLIAFVSFTQNNFKSEFLSAQTSYMEIKDQINHGFVFKGPDIMLDFGFEKRNEKSYFDYAFSFNGGGKTVIGTWGFRWNIIPVKTSYGFKFYKNEKLSLYTGPTATASYSIQNYPDMHSGHLNWMTNYSLGAKIFGLFNFKGKDIKLQFKNSLLSMASRPKTERDQHYFSLKFGDVFSDAHSNMVLGSINKFTQTEFNAEVFLNGKKRKHSVSYTFQYTAYFDEPRFKQLAHGIKYTVYLKKHDHEKK